MGDFVIVCGRGGSHAAPGPIKDACQAALSTATQWSLAVAAFGFVVAVVYYLLASRTITRDLNEAAQRS
ncbi:hypothetical protein [Phenylobacterium sp.]|uniref:hypothetical protein n=1 Tax=Phenylobacterium sp. TaxID=1871053 RepID=UPI0027376D24|nr:hypothetical protein [Phenylobacterium sp.]MDP3660272.1 hypothetical protein [Phenylobacterium sp.]